MPRLWTLNALRWIGMQRPKRTGQDGELGQFSLEALWLGFAAAASLWFLHLNLLSREMDVSQCWQQVKSVSNGIESINQSAAPPPSPPPPLRDGTVHSRARVA